jgi:hypothetical protein
MPLTFEQASQKAVICAALVHSKIRKRPATSEDIQALSACVMQLAGMVQIMAPMVPDIGAIVPQDSLVTPLLPKEYADAVAHYFRASLEGEPIE